MLYVNLKKCLKSDSNGSVTLDAALFDQLLQAAISSTDFDEFYYRKHNPDVASAINKGAVRSAHEHFVLFGYKEGRLPRNVPVDEKYYVAGDGNLKQLVDSGDMTVREHFERYGSSEGRAPYDGFSLFKPA